MRTMATAAATITTAMATVKATKTTLTAAVTNGDGDLDMVVGEKNGTLTLFERTSLGSWSKYISPIHGENWGNILVDNLLGINGYSVPALTPTSR